MAVFKVLQYSMEIARFALWLLLMILLSNLPGRASANDSDIQIIKMDSEFNVSAKYSDIDIIQMAFQSVSGLNVSDVCGSARRCGSSIREIKLNSWKLSGVVNWRVLSKLPHLKTLDLSHNSLSGRLGDNLWKMTTLTSLNLASNALGGTLNFNVFQRFSALHTVNVSYNKFCTFDNTMNLESFRKLKIVDLSHNKIMGNKVLAQLLTLESVSKISLAGNNFLSITSPLVLSRKKNSSRLKYLDLSHCNLNGTIDSLARISSLLYLDLSCNNLSGPFTIDVGHKLQFLNISYNNFSRRAKDVDVKKFGPAAFFNSRLCNSAIKSYPKNSFKFHTMVISVSLALVLLIVLVVMTLLLVYKRSRRDGRAILENRRPQPHSLECFFQ